MRKQRKKTRVFDSSAILAYLYNERGKPLVRTLLKEYTPIISSVNISEILGKLIDDDMPLDTALEIVNSLEMTIVPFDLNLAGKTAELRPLTQKLGLSLGDRACIATAMEAGSPVVSAERIWEKLDVCEVHMIR